jgi:hypothetical protein
VTRPLTKREISALVGDLSLLLSKIKSGELKSSSVTQLRIEGAITALNVVLRESEATALDIANDPLL